MKKLKCMVGALSFSLFYIFISIFFHLPLCPFYNLFHIPCPGYGITRSFKALFLEWNLKKSLQYNILTIPIFLGALICFVIKTYEFLHHTSFLTDFFHQHKNILIIGAIILTILSFYINLKNPLLY